VQAHRADAIAAALGLKKVGLLFNQRAGERDYIMNDAEIALACRVQALVGEHGITAIFLQTEGEGLKVCEKGNRNERNIKRIQWACTLERIVGPTLLYHVGCCFV
jgi:hypothetical protein